MEKKLTKNEDFGMLQMLLKKENKLLFQFNQKIDQHKRTSSSASKRSLIKIPSTSKLPQDFYGHSDPITRTVKHSDRKDCSISKPSMKESLLFTFRATNSEKFHDSVDSDLGSQKFVKKSSVNYDPIHYKGLKKTGVLRKNLSEKHFFLENHLSQ